MVKLLLAATLILAACQSTSATVPSSYAPVTPSAFAPWPSETAQSATFPPMVAYRPVATPTARPEPSPTRAYRSPVPCCILPPFLAVKGTATWYAHPAGHAAAALRLRDALGPNWRGMRVKVCKSVSTYQCVTVILDDFESSTIPGRLIDLAAGDFARLAPLGAGVLSVTVEGR